MPKIVVLLAIPKIDLSFLEYLLRVWIIFSEGILNLALFYFVFPCPSEIKCQ